MKIDMSDILSLLDGNLYPTMDYYSMVSFILNSYLIYDFSGSYSISNYYLEINDLEEEIEIYKQNSNCVSYYFVFKGNFI